jgi:two-component system NarL family sensor kinase
LLAVLRRIERAARVIVTLRELVLRTAPYAIVSSTLAAAATQTFINDTPLLFLGLIFVLLGSEVILRGVVAAASRAAEVARLTRERAELLEQALEAEAAERAWLASHLHDNTLQLVAAAQQDLAEDDVESANDRLAEITTELRHTLTHFHPASIAEVGLQAALTAYAGQLSRRRRTRFSIEADSAADLADAPLLYSLGREFLTNAAKHARAEHIGLTVRVDHQGTHLQVTDDGVGFDPALRAQQGHIGLAAARRRVEARGGHLEIDSAPGRGTTVLVQLPER